MREGRLKLHLEELTVDSFASTTTFFDGVGVQSIYQETVLNETEQYSCNGSCGTCGGTDCYA